MYAKIGRQKMNPVDHDFKVCRVCIRPPQEGEEFTQMFENDGEIARKFILVSGVDISFDFERQNQVLICGTCLEDLTKAYELREKIEQYDELYFETRRLVEPIKEDPGADGAPEASTNATADSVTLTAIEGSQFKFEPDDSALSEPKAESSTSKVEQDDSKQSESKAKSSTSKNRTCEICSKTFSARQALLRHNKTIHEKNKDYPCSVCEKTFALHWNLKAHLICTHIDKNLSPIEIKKALQSLYKFRCDECDEIFDKKGDLNAHVFKKHKSTRPKRAEDFQGLVSCPICLEIFDSDGAMNRHKRQMHPSTSKFQCLICQRSLSSKQSLLQHTNSFHNDKPQYQCKVCSLNFSTKASRKSHIIHNHPSKDSNAE